MNSPLNPSERDNVIQSFLIGTGRRPFEAPAAFSGARPDAAILGALALAATERRFVRPLPDRPAAARLPCRTMNALSCRRRPARPLPCSSPCSAGATRSFS
jgi:hypothetical protein